MSIQFRHAVTGSGPLAIVQAPAWGPSSDYLRLTLVPLLTGLRVVTFDPRNVGGSGRSETPPERALERLVEDLDHMRSCFDGERFVLIGHSHGGFIAMAYAARHAERLAGLILLNTTVRRRIVDAEVEEILGWMQRDPQRATAVRLFRETSGRLAPVDSDADLARRLRALMPVYFYDLEAMHRFLRAIRDAPPPSAAALASVPDDLEGWVERALPAVEVPALVITGRQDVATPPADAERLRGLLPNAEMTILENSGHHPWVEQPEAFRAAVAAFLARLEMPG